MSKVDTMRAFVNQRLTAAADEIFELFKRTITEYEEKLESISQEKNRQWKLLDALYNPEVRLQRADVQPLLVIRNEAPAVHQETSSRLNQEDPEPPFIKQEQEEVGTCQDRGQLQEKEVNTSPVTAKCEEDEEEKAEYSQLHESQIEEDREGTEADGEDCGGSAPACPLQTAIHNNTAGCSEPETDDSSEWEGVEDPQPDLNTLEITEVTGSDVGCNNEKTSVSASECATHKRHLQKKHGLQNGDKPSSSSIGGKKSSRKKSLTVDKIHNSKTKCFSCSVCKASFSAKGGLVTHMRTHTGKKPFRCPVCGKGFPQLETLNEHKAIHTVGKAFSCSVCSKKFALLSNLKRHAVIHTGDKAFSCSLCSKTFADYRNLRRHMTRFTGEKPFSCTNCNKSYTRRDALAKHKCVGDTSRNSSFMDAC